MVIESVYFLCKYELEKFMYYFFMIQTQPYDMINDEQTQKGKKKLDKPLKMF